MRCIDGTVKRNGDTRSVVLLVALLLAPAMAACAPQAAPTAAEPTVGSDDEASLAGTAWVLTTLGGSPLLDGTRITLEFEPEWLGGFAGCNTYGGGPSWGGYTATTEGTLTIPMLAITVEACPLPEGVMEQERAYVEALDGATAYRLEGDRLDLQNSSGETTLSFDRQEEYDGNPGDLPGTAWQLVSMDGQALSGSSTITLAFHDENRLSGHAGCRDYVVVYQADGGDLGAIYQAMLGPICPEPELREQEGAFTTMLSEATHYRLGEGQLEFFTARGETLLFEPLLQGARAGLEGPTWSLLALVDPNPAEDMPLPLPLPVNLLAGTEISLAFEGGTAQGSAGCNNYQAAYTLDSTSMTLENLSFTEMGCLTPEGVLEQEGRYLDILRDVTTYHVYGERLWLETADGRALVFSSKPEGLGSAG